MSTEDVLDERGGFRVRLEADQHPDEPYDDGQSPILSLHYRHGWHAEHVDPGTFRPRDCDADIQRAAEHFGSDTDKLERYLKAYHGCTQIVEWFDRDGTRFITYDDRAWREKVGAPEGSASLAEWQAYCEGDVFGYVIEKRVKWTADDDAFPPRDAWEYVHSCGGYFGHDHAEQAATEEFDAFMTTAA
ncbi:MAG: hypothetical protein J2P17_31160 [Mycobacterium sp.]|nr:hypothetical protein [Mycobacterium sp.]